MSVTFGSQSPSGIPNTNNSVKSITQQARTEPFELQVSRGSVAGHTPVTIEGYNSSISTSWAPICSSGSLPILTSATVLEISSSSANDTSSGTGAQLVTITGLNASYLTISETVVLNGQTAVNTVNSYIAVNGFVVTAAGSGGTNAGIIYAGTGTVTAGVPATIVDSIPAGWGNRQNVAYTVPANITAYVASARITFASSSSSNNVWGRLQLFNPVTGVTTSAAVVVSTIASGVVYLNPGYPIMIPSGTTVYAQAEGVQTGTYLVSAFLRMVLISNGV